MYFCSISPCRFCLILFLIVLSTSCRHAFNNRQQFQVALFCMFRLHRFFLRVYTLSITEHFFLVLFSLFWNFLFPSHDSHLSASALYLFDIKSVFFSFNQIHSTFLCGFVLCRCYTVMFTVLILRRTWKRFTGVSAHTECNFYNFILKNYFLTCAMAQKSVLY